MIRQRKMAINTKSSRKNSNTIKRNDKKHELKLIHKANSQICKGHQETGEAGLEQARIALDFVLLPLRQLLEGIARDRKVLLEVLFLQVLFEVGRVDAVGQRSRQQLAPRVATAAPLGQQLFDRFDLAVHLALLQASPRH